MKRQFKFRIYDKINKIMTTDVVIDPDWTNLYNKDSQIHLELIGKNNYSSNITKLEGGGWSEESLVVQQFTGLLDINGKEIYEGDIVKYCNKIDIIKWERARWNCPLDASGECDLWDISSQIEIISNIFENPELIENK